MTPEELEEEKKKKKFGLIEALKKQNGESKGTSIIEILKNVGSKGLPDRDIKKK